MKNKLKTALLMGGLLAISSSANAVPILFDWGLSVDGSFSDSFNPVLQPEIDDSAFDFDSGIGIVTATISGEGAHSVGAWFNHDLNPDFEDDTATMSGTAAAGQSWELDDSGAGAFDGNGNPIYFGDVAVPNFFDDEALDNQAFHDAISNVNYGDLLGGSDDGLGTDVSMAIMWDFVLAPDEAAVIDFFVNEPPPAGAGVVLTQSDASESIVFTSSMVVNREPPPTPVSLPGTLPLTGIGIALVGFVRRKRRRVSAA